VFVDLGACPPSNSFLSKYQLDNPEIHYPLKLNVCSKCFLVQVDEHKAASEIFCDEYVYFSSFSQTWLDFARNYVETIVKRLKLDAESFVVEIASNDGYLLQFVKAKQIPCLGVEPSGGTAAVAVAKGIEVIQDFFGTKLAKKLVAQGRQADLLIGHNVLAHVPDINDFVEGLKIALKPDGTVNMQFPHLMQLVANNQFDTIYHEHFSYLSLLAAQKIFAAHGLIVYDLEEIPVHGGSLRVYARHAGYSTLEVSSNVNALLARERALGMDTLAYYDNFQSVVNKTKYDFLEFLIHQKKLGKKISAYGAAAKGNTLLNYCGIKKDLVDFVVDASPHKQGKFLPTSRIPVVKESRLKEEKPDFVLVLPWNIKEEIMEQLKYIRGWGGKFVIAIPKLEIVG
jgi:SAM-dependent methyltransferase